jgi:RNA polymerase primary sigma factor
MSMRRLVISKSITSRESQSLDKYLKEIGKQELLSSEEEVLLAVKIRQGDRKAFEKLIKANLRFVVSVAKQYQNLGLTLPDLINEGNLGLIKAAQRFDETKGFKFISYSVWWIRQSILSAIAEKSRLIRVPINKAGIDNKITNASEILQQQFEREPTSEELAEHLNVTIEEVTATLLRNTRPVISMDSPLSDEEETSMIDVLEDENVMKADERLVKHESLDRDIDCALKMLNPKQREILCFFYGIGVDHPLSLEDIAERFSVSRERVRQIKETALNQLRRNTHCKRLKGYLG